jgi:hypothetical protein
VRPVLVIAFGVGVVLALCAGPLGAATAATAADRPDGREDVRTSSALLGGVDALPAFRGRTVSGGRLDVLRSLRVVADVGVGAAHPHPRAGRLGQVPFRVNT